MCGYHRHMQSCPDAARYWSLREMGVGKGNVRREIAMRWRVVRLKEGCEEESLKEGAHPGVKIRARGVRSRAPRSVGVAMPCDWENQPLPFSSSSISSYTEASLVLSSPAGVLSSSI